MQASMTVRLLADALMMSDRFQADQRTTDEGLL